MRKPLAFLIVASFMGMIAPAVDADTVQWPSSKGGNDHWYAIVRDTTSPYVTWTEARNLSQAATFIDLGGNLWQGHLATLTSAAEHTFVSRSDFLGDSYSLYGDWVWIGGYQTPTLQPENTEGNLPADNWHWVTGEAWSYTHWQGGQPDNSDNLPWQSQNYLSKAAGWWSNDGWNDGANIPAPTGTGRVAYIIEYEPGTTAVPEPSTLAMFIGLGVTGIALNHLRRRRTRTA